MYRYLIKPFFFIFNAEFAHYFALNGLKVFLKMPLAKWVLRCIFPQEKKGLERTIFGLAFKNPIGLAAGFDKNAKYFRELSYLGFGFIEIGTVTPKPQKGTPKKRLFRLVKDRAIINRMGFNNDGVEKVCKRLSRRPKGLIIGGNIGKNKTTPEGRAVEDYLICFEKLFDYVDYFVVNVSSPNTPNLRKLQNKENLLELLMAIQNRNLKKPNPKPILLKIAPDLNKDMLLDIIETVKQTQISGIVATNTTVSREDLVSKNKNEVGGLSGKPVAKKATEIITFISENSRHSIPIIGVGGIFSSRDAKKKIEAGASLLQVYTGFIYKGPRLIKEIIGNLKKEI